MKKKSTFLILLATLLLAVVPLEGFAYKSKLVGLTGNFAESGGIYTVHNNGGNNHVTSHIEASAFTLEAKVQLIEGDRCMSFVFGSTGYDHDKWYGVELAVRDGKAHTKAFQDHGHGLFFEVFDIETNINDPIPFKINVTESGQLTVFVDGNQVAQHTIPDYITGRLGILTWRSVAVLTDLWVDFGGEEGTKVDLEDLTGNFSTPKSYTIYRNPGRDNYIFSSTSATTFSCEGKVNILEGDRMSILFGVGENQNNAFAVELLKKEGEVDIKAFQFKDNGDFYGGDTRPQEGHGIAANTSQPIPFKIEVLAGNKLNVYVDGNKVNDSEIQVNAEYTGGRLGFLTWNSRAVFSDVVLMIDGQEKQFENLSGDYSSPKDIYTINNNDNNNFISSSTSAAAFSYQATVQDLIGDKCVSFIFGAIGGSDDPFYGAEVNTSTTNSVRVKIFHDKAGEAEPNLHIANISANTSQPITFKIDVTASGLVTLYVNGVQATQYQIVNYHPGKLGLLTWKTKATVSDIVVIKKDEEGSIPGNFNTNLEGWAKDPNTNGTWMITSDGLLGIGNGNSPYFSTTSASDFVLESNMKYLSNDTQAGGIIFRANADHSVYYAVDINNSPNGREAKTVRVLKFYKNPTTGQISDITLGGTIGNLKTLPGYNDQNKEFNVRIEAVKSNIMVYVEDQLLVAVSDSEVLEGVFGVTNFSSQVLFQDMFYTALTDLPLLSALTLDVEFTPAFSNEVFKYNARVPFETNEISITASTGAENNLFINDEAVVSGTAKAVSLEEGENIIWVKVQDKVSEVSTVTAVYVKRKQNPETAYTEKYRPQFHYTPEANWVNDPNGMVYYEGEYHLFYQYHPYDKQWGPMHWGHAISPDMVHWEEYPIALYPDQYGTMYSGSAVVDVNNTTGFFTDLPEQKGLVAIYTNHAGNGDEQQAIAYSKDKGRTWTKYNDGEPVIKVTDDPYNHRDFRDPKVFWHEESNQWMMVIAGGPLRFFSSPNLIDWTFESGNNVDQVVDGKTVGAIHTECPDFFKLPVEGGSGDKWVLTRSSKTYMIGEFKEVGGKWHFIPDANTAPAMNFGHDNYAAQTYSDMPDDRRVMVNWMTNFDYAGDLANITDPYNGTFTMAYELKLKDTPTGIKLYQNPIEEYQSLRKTPFSVKNVTVGSDDENILKDLKCTEYEIVAEFTPGANTTLFGFDLRTGGNQVTKVSYSMRSNVLSVNRINSGANPNGSFLGSYSRGVNLQDGKLKLHIFVDASMIEVFANDGEAVASLLIFPEPTSDGMAFSVTGSDPVECNIDIYPLKSIWREDNTDPWTSIYTPEVDSSLKANVYTTKGTLNIDLTNDAKSLKLDVYNIDGKLITSQQIVDSRSQLALGQGVYIVKLANNEQSVVKKVVIK